MAANILRSGKLHSQAQPISSSRSGSSHKKYEYSYFFKQDNEVPVIKSHHSQTILNTKNGQQQSPTPISKLESCVRQENNKNRVSEEEFAFLRENRMKRFQSHSNMPLDPRDQKVRIKFKSQYYQTLLKKNFETSIKPFEDQVRDYLVDLIEICTSIGYNHLNRETMTEKETKNFVAKNVLENIKTIFQQYKQIPLEMRYQLMKFVNNQTFMIFDHIARKYPQTRSKGVSKRLKSKVPVIDNRQSNEFDFLYRNKIEFKYKDDGDYSEDIMKIINKLISFSNQVYDKHMELQDSNYEVFSEIMEYIFENSIYQTAQVTANEIVNMICSKKNKIEKRVQCVYSSRIPEEGQIDDDQSSLDTRKLLRIKDFQKQVLIGQKIPIGVKMFSDEDIESSNFVVHDSSILRLLTKWAEQLRNKIMNAQETIYRRRFKFKTNKGKLVNLEPQMKHILYKAAIEQKKNIEEQLKILKEENYYLQTIFAEEENIGKYSKHDTKICIYAAKLNQMASQYIFKYINILIHALLTIPRKAAQNVATDRQRTVIQSLNLVTFKIGDMMRCKCSCSQHQFVKILKAMDTLNLMSPNIMKISRIKDRLDTQNNDILINFFFGDKAQCQLQLSVMSLEKKDEKNSSKFSHLIYEIVRAQLGPMSQMATIVVQYDPLAQYYSKQQNYSPLLLNAKKTLNDARLSKQHQQRVVFRKNFSIGDCIQLPFVCCTCQHLAIVHNPEFYYRNLEENSIRQCNQCLQGSFSYSNINSRKLKAHVINQNFPNNPDMQTFFQKHIKLWNSQAFIEELKNETDQMVSSSWFPQKGFAIRFNQKKPKLQFFTSLFEPTYSYVVFGHKNQKKQKKILFAIKIHEQKEKKIQNIQKQLKKFALLQLRNINEVQEGQERFLVCNNPDCCGLKVNPGPMLTRNEIQQFIDNKMITKLVQYQKDLLYLNFMPSSLQKLESHLMKVKEKNKVWKVRNLVQSIEAFQCKLDNIKVVSLFSKLQDLNIGNNPSLKSLKGIENCKNMKYLNCSDCDLEHIQELSDLISLETLNLTNNKRLNCIKALQQHLDLQDLFIRNTAIHSLAPLENCLKLQSLDLQGCQNITSIREVKSTKLTYISIINCYGIQTFDLPPNTLKSLRTVELSKSNEVTRAVFSFMMDNIMRNSERSISRHSSETIIDDEALTKINEALKIRKTNSITLLSP